MRLSTLVRRLRRNAAPGDGCSDAELLARFVRSGDDAAFELLVWRHGAMVLAACRRILTNAEDAEDAFQAVFLVLARKARGVWRGSALPAWLHRVAVRIAVRVARSRRTVAPLVAEPPAEQKPDPAIQAETLGILDEEIDRLPDRCRRAVVLCYLEGLSAAEAGQRLGCPTGTVESRLAAARRKLRDRLTRRGITLPVGAMAVAAAQVTIAPEAVAQTTRAAAAFVRGGVVANETSVRLAKGVLTMWQARTWAAVFLGAAVLALGTGIGWANWPATQRANPEANAADLPTAPAPQAKGEAAPPATADSWPLARRIAVGESDALVGVAPDGRTLVLRQGGSVYGLDLNQNRGRNSSTFRIQSPNEVYDAAVSPDGKYVATAEDVQGVNLRDSATREVLEAFWPSGKLPARQVAFTPDGSRLVALGYRYDRPADGPRKSKGVPGDTKSTAFAQVSVWDVATRKELGHPVETTVVPRTAEPGALGPTYNLDRTGRFVLKTEVLLAEPKRDPETTVPTGGPWTQQVSERIGLRFTIIDALTGKAGQPVEIKDPIFTGLGRIDRNSISPDGKTVAVRDAKNSNELRLFDLTTGKERVQLSQLLRPIGALTFSPDGKYVAAASRFEPYRGVGNPGGPDAHLAAPSEVVIWDAANGKELARIHDKDTIRDYAALRFSPDGSFLVAQEGSGALSIWGRPPKPEPEAEPIKTREPWGGKEPPAKKKNSAPTPAAPAGVPDRFQALFQSLSAAEVTDPRRIEAVFLATLGRLPTDVEARTLAAQFARQTDKAAALRDLLNTLVDTAEFKAHAEALRKLSK